MAPNHKSLAHAQSVGDWREFEEICALKESQIEIQQKLIEELKAQQTVDRERYNLIGIQNEKLEEDREHLLEQIAASNQQTADENEREHFQLEHGAFIDQQNENENEESMDLQYELLVVRTEMDHESSKEVHSLVF